MLSEAEVLSSKAFLLQDALKTQIYGNNVQASSLTRGFKEKAEDFQNKLKILEQK